MSPTPTPRQALAEVRRLMRRLEKMEGTLIHLILLEKKPKEKK